MKASLGLIIAILAIIRCQGSIAPLLTEPAVHPTFIQTPQYNSALVRSDRFGGNFVYSVSESQAYQPISRVSFSA